MDSLTIQHSTRPSHSSQIFQNVSLPGWQNFIQLWWHAVHLLQPLRNSKILLTTYSGANLNCFVLVRFTTIGLMTSMMFAALQRRTSEKKDLFCYRNWCRWITVWSTTEHYAKIVNNNKALEEHYAWIFRVDEDIAMSSCDLHVFTCSCRIDTMMTKQNSLLDLQWVFLPILTGSSFPFLRPYKRTDYMPTLSQAYTSKLFLISFRSHNNFVDLVSIYISLKNVNIIWINDFLRNR